MDDAALNGRLKDLEPLFRKAVETVCVAKTGLVFSSGVDSTLVAYAAAEHTDLTAYVVGLEGSEDVKYARRLEESAPFKIRYSMLRQEEAEPIVRKILSVWPRPNPIDVGVGIPMFMASSQAKADGIRVMLCGQGGDELFGGYWRYLECMVEKGPDAVAAWMEKDWKNAWADNLDRDVAMNAANGCELRFPYLDRGFSDYARKMPLTMKIAEGGALPSDEAGGRRFVRKYALKRLALAMGVPDYVVNRPKKAAQYGSGSNKTLEKLARNGGYAKKAADEQRTDYVRYYLEELQKQP